MPRRKGIVRKTFLFSFLLITLVVLLSFAVLYFAMPRYYLYQKEHALQKNLNALTASLKTAEDQNACAALITDFVNENNANVMSLTSDDMLLPELSSPFVSMQGGEDRDAFYTIIRKAGNEEGQNYSLSVRLERKQTYVDDQPLKESSQPVVIAKGGKVSGDAISIRGEVGTPIIGYIVAAGTLQPIDEAKGVILSLIPYVLLSGIAAGLLLAWLYARQISKPVLQISKAAVRMQQMDPDALSGVVSDDELGELSRNLDELYAALRENIGSLQNEMEQVNRLERSKTEMMQGASHELKTPITALSGMLDGMIDNVGAYKDRDKYLIECKGQVEKLSALVGEILLASKADALEERAAPQETEIDLLLRRSLDDFFVLIRQKGLRITEVTSRVTVMTDPAAMYRVLGNLVSNAVRYTPCGGEIIATLSEHCLSIENECSPIPEDELEKLFEPFYTRSYSRGRDESGTGLGLYIVKRNLEQLGVACKTESTGRGLKISLFF